VGVNCDRLAPWYEFLERATYGDILWRARTHFLPQLSGRVLLLGDGDGRFAAQLAQRRVTVEVLELSAGMITQAQKRPAAQSIRFHHADARTWPFPPAHYDAVVAHFFWDCFNPADLAPLLARVLPSLKPGGLWIISEFRAERWWQRWVVRAMYVAFGWLTGLRVRQLPGYEAAFQTAGLRKVAERTRLAGLVVSQQWRVTL
jgi:SAM-dependent methyltransferase